MRIRPANAHHVVPLAPLPARIRLRLMGHRRIDRIGCHLVNRDHPRAAEWLWRACRMW
jgi:hypothetical protein